MKHLDKYIGIYMDGGKIPRKAKKAILGTLPTKKELRERIENVKIINGELDDDFCPFCGCYFFIGWQSSQVEYPQYYSASYCARCGENLSESDNGSFNGVLLNYKLAQDGEYDEEDKKLTLRDWNNEIFHR